MLAGGQENGKLPLIHIAKQRAGWVRNTWGKRSMAATDSRWNAIAIARSFAGSLWVEPPPRML